MFKDRTIAVVVPCHNEAALIGNVVRGIPSFVDRIIVVDDASTDNTADVVEQLAQADPHHRLQLVRRPNNGGCGAAVASGYKEVLRQGIDIAAVMDGDGQMDPTQLEWLIAPVASGEADYAKGNRLFYPGARQIIPASRFLGNAFLSMLTKIASGYWHVADSQSGFVAISRGALEFLDVDSLYPRYGYLNDILIRLNVYGFRVRDVNIRPVYGVGERSKMRIHRVIPRIGGLIVKRFCWRLWEKYVIRDFHPLVLFYLSAAALHVAGIGLLGRMVYMWVTTDRLPPINTLMWVFCAISSIQLSLFAMWFDMEMNRELHGWGPEGPPHRRT